MDLHLLPSVRRLIVLGFLVSCTEPQVGLETGEGGQVAGNRGGGGAGSGDAGGSVGTGGSSITTLPFPVGGTGDIGGTAGTLPQPIGEWLFDEGAGNSVRDSSGSGNTARVMEGKVVNSPIHKNPQWVPGHRGYALQLDGINDWVRVETSDSISRTGAVNMVSISAWIYLPRLQSQAPFVQRRVLGTLLKDYFVGSDNSGSLGVGVSFFYGSAIDTLPIGRWTHIAMAYDGIQQCGYVNGSRMICQDVGWPLEVRLIAPVTMGADVFESDVVKFLEGAIDDVRLYDVALTELEISTLARR